MQACARPVERISRMGDGAPIRITGPGSKLSGDYALNRTLSGAAGHENRLTVEGSQGQTLAR
jgi:hypothetical protein